MKTNRGKRGRLICAPLTAVQDVGERSNSTPQNFVLWKETRFPMQRSQDRHQSRSGRFRWRMPPWIRIPDLPALSESLYLRRGLHWTTLHTTRRRLHSQAFERAASKLTTPITWTNVIAGQSATSAFVLSEQNCVLSQPASYPNHLNCSNLQAGW
jgi:hypothetical protein